MYIVQLLPMWVPCCALTGAVWGREACLALAPWLGGPRQGPGAIWVPGCRAYVGVPTVPTPPVEKKRAGVWEEGRSLS